MITRGCKSTGLTNSSPVTASYQIIAVVTSAVSDWSNDLPQLHKVLSRPSLHQVGVSDDLVPYECKQFCVNQPDICYLPPHGQSTPTLQSALRSFADSANPGTYGNLR